MKKASILIVFALFFVQLVQAQCINQCLLSVHTVQIQPNEGVEVQSIIDFLENKLYPAYSKELDCEIRLSKGLNRENKGKIGIVYYYKSKESFNLFWNDEGSPTEKGLAVIEKLEPLQKQLQALGNIQREHVEDWVTK